MTVENDSAENEPVIRGGRWLASASWLRDYQPAWLRLDLVAGVTLAAYLLPAAIADASLAGLPPEAGLYACLYSGLAFWLFCSSRHTAITVTSATSQAAILRASRRSRPARRSSSMCSPFSPGSRTRARSSTSSPRR